MTEHNADQPPGAARSSAPQGGRTCPGCGVIGPIDSAYCAQCGAGLVPGQTSVSSGLKWGLAVLSVPIPLVGLIGGLLHVTDASRAKREVGRLWLFAGVVGTAFVGTVYAAFALGLALGAAGATGNQVRGGPAAQEGEVTIDAAKLSAEFRVGNGEVAEARYVTKVLQVTGRIDGVDSDKLVIWFYTKGDATQSGRIRCVVRAAGELRGLQAGRQVTVRGKCDGWDKGTIHLADCTVER